MRILRVYHGGRSVAHRCRERALLEEGVDVSLVVPASWPEPDTEPEISEEFRVIELPVSRPGDVNRHTYRDLRTLRKIIDDVQPELLDIHEEPFSLAGKQWLTAARATLPVVMYTAQNVDKRFPPPFAQHEHSAHRRVSALYPCSTQAASVARGKGFTGLIDVLPLGYDEAVFTPGSQSLDDHDLVLALFGRLVPEKGVTDAVRVLAHVHAARPARLHVVGAGPEEEHARKLAESLGVADRLEFEGWRPPVATAARYQRAHVVLLTSHPTTTWVEQFGRVIVEAQASGAVIAGYRCGAIPEVAGEAAVLTRVGATGALADEIINLVADPAAFSGRRELGMASSRTRTWAQVARRQIALYQQVLAGDFQRVDLPRSPASRRAAAREEFGPPAPASAGARPFALPLMRNGSTAAWLLATLLDATFEIAARLSEWWRTQTQPTQ